jgi:GDP-L-fucose synthase
MSDAGGFAYSLAGKRVWVAGHRGLVGSALVRRLAAEDCEVLTVDRADLDLRRQADTERWIADSKPDAIVIAAALVGGIQANSARPAEFLYDNLAIEANVIDGAHRNDVDRLLFLGSNCMYPVDCPQPMREEYLLTGVFEETNLGYATAKMAGAMLCRSYREQYGRSYATAIPASIYGPGDNLDQAANHVIPAAIEKVVRARRVSGEVEIWGSGKPRREYMYVDDAADGLVFLLKRYDDAGPINIGCGSEVTISELYETIGRIVGFTGGFRCDTSRPDGMPFKRLDSSRIEAMGWKAPTSLEDGLSRTCDWFLETENAT